MVAQVYGQAIQAEALAQVLNRAISDIKSNYRTYRENYEREQDES